MNILSIIILIFAIIGIIDKLLGNKLGLGKEFERGENAGEIGANGGEEGKKLVNVHIKRRFDLYDSAGSSKPQKVLKTPLTNGGGSAIICELSTRQRLSTRGTPSERPDVEAGQNITKKVEKTFEKPLDKIKKM